MPEHSDIFNGSLRALRLSFPEPSEIICRFGGLDAPLSQQSVNQSLLFGHLTL